jgi:hypothetical protein
MTIRVFPTATEVRKMRHWNLFLFLAGVFWCGFLACSSGRTEVVLTVDVTAIRGQTAQSAEGTASSPGEGEEAQGGADAGDAGETDVETQRH